MGMISTRRRHHLTADWARRPSKSRRTTAATSFRGERRPLSNTVGIQTESRKAIACL
jgi:hypothetical protein